MSFPTQILLAYLMILILWVAFLLHWWFTRQEIDELRNELEDLSSRLPRTD